MKTLLFLSVLIVAAGPAWEQTEHAPGPDCPMKEAVAASPYAGMEQREIKAISDDDRRRLLQGHGMGLALAAELNRFPGPKHVLELAAGLGLSDEQIRKTGEIFETMERRAQRLGREVIDREAELDAGFASGTMDEESLATIVREIGRLRGELRLTHLRAHVKMRAVLSAEQVEAYDRLRGYRPVSTSSVPAR